MSKNRKIWRCERTEGVTKEGKPEKGKEEEKEEGGVKGGEQEQGKKKMLHLNHDEQCSSSMTEHKSTCQ